LAKRAHTFATLMSRLSAAGFKKQFARVAVLPDWWEEACETDEAVLPDVEIRVARFIGAPLGIVRNPDEPLAAPTYPGAQLRRVRDIQTDRLAPAIHAAVQTAAAVVRSMKPQALRLPPSDPLEWRKEILGSRSLLGLQGLAADLWARGIPIIHIESIPAPTFQGLVCIVEGRPVIVIGHDLDAPARLAFIIGHETGHIINGDCTPDHPVIDELEEVLDDHEIEKRADAYATQVTTGGIAVPDVRASNFKELATIAHKVEQESGVDASAVVWAWARRTGNYPLATMAAQALYKTTHGRRILRRQFDENVDLDSASDSDRALLRCLYGDPDRNAAAS
jgi:hypothetical protein